MFCDRCKKYSATIHLTEIIKDDRSDAHLCENCAKEIGLNTKLSNFSLTTSDMLSFLDVNEISIEDINLGDVNRICRSCGNTFIDFKRTGKVGCEDCYSYMDDLMSSLVLSYHGEKRHIGKIPSFYGLLKEHEINSNSNEPSIKNEDCENLLIKLDQAILEERYEDAAVLRDIMRKR